MDIIPYFCFDFSIQCYRTLKEPFVFEMTETQVNKRLYIFQAAIRPYVCVNLKHVWRDLLLKVDSERQIFVKFFKAILINRRVFVRYLIRSGGRRNIFSYYWRCLTWGSNRGLTSNKPTHFILDYGDFNIYIYI